MRQETKHTLIKISYLVASKAALAFATIFAKRATYPKSEIIAGIGILLFLFNLVCWCFLSDELHEAEISKQYEEIYKRQAEHYANLYYKEVKHHGKTTKKENETS